MIKGQNSWRWQNSYAVQQVLCCELKDSWSTSITPEGRKKQWYHLVNSEIGFVYFKCFRNLGRYIIRSYKNSGIKICTQSFVFRQTLSLCPNTSCLKIWAPKWNGLISDQSIPYAFLLRNIHATYSFDQQNKSKTLIKLGCSAWKITNLADTKLTDEVFDLFDIAHHVSLSS